MAQPGAVEYEFVALGAEVTVHQGKGCEHAGREQQARREYTGKKFAYHQHFTAHRSQKVVMQAALDHVAAEQPGKNADAAEENAEAYVIDLEDAGQDQGV